MSKTQVTKVEYEAKVTRTVEGAAVRQVPFNEEGRTYRPDTLTTIYRRGEGESWTATLNRVDGWRIKKDGEKANTRTHELLWPHLPDTLPTWFPAARDDQSWRARDGGAEG